MERNPRQPTDTKEHIQHSANNKTDTDERRCTSPSKDEPSWSTPRTNPTRRNAKESPHHNEAHGAHASTRAGTDGISCGRRETVRCGWHNRTGCPVADLRRRFLCPRRTPFASAGAGCGRGCCDPSAGYSHSAVSCTSCDSHREPRYRMDGDRTGAVGNGCWSAGRQPCGGGLAGCRPNARPWT